MTFIETPRFPDEIALGSGGGPNYLTTIVELQSGHEQRNIGWTLPRYRYNVAMGVQGPSELETLLTFFHAVRGRGHSFRFKDWMDYKSCALDATPAATDQLLGSGDGVQTTFQLVKVYTAGALTISRKITKPVTGTVLVAINDVPQGSGWTVNTTTGLVTITTPPGAGLSVKAGYEFDVPCRFDTDFIDTRIEGYQVGSTDVNIIEIRI